MSFSADHGLAVDNIAANETRRTATTVPSIVTEQLPLASLCRRQGLTLTVVDSGIAEPVARHERLLARKIAHGTRNSRLGKAMSIEQAQAAIRAGIEIGESLDGNAVACAGIGVGCGAERCAGPVGAFEGADLGFVGATPRCPRVFWITRSGPRKRAASVASS